MLLWACCPKMGKTQQKIGMEVGTHELTEAVLAVVLQQSNHGIHMVDTEGSPVTTMAPPRKWTTWRSPMSWANTYDVFPSLNKIPVPCSGWRERGKPIIDQH